MPLRQHLRAIYGAAVAAADPRAAVAGALGMEEGALVVAGREHVPLAEVERILLVGAGKAACGMAAGALEVLGGWVAEGTVTTVDGAAAPLEGIDVWEAAHPLPDTRGLAGAAEALRLARSARSGDLLLCLLSGGASALWAAPPAGVTLEELRAATRALLRSGAPIAEVNAVRKHLSRIAGGGLARAASPARLLTLAVSDVVGGGVDAIGSGPTCADASTFADALEVVRGRDLRVPAAVLGHLQAGALGEREETVKASDPVLARASLHVVASVRDALAGAAREAVRLGYRPRVVSDEVVGEAREVAGWIAGVVRQAMGSGPQALLFGGETTVTVRGDGVGGRSHELALALALELAGVDGFAALAAGTDGIDGPTPAAGGFADAATVERGRRAGMDAEDALRRSDAHPFLRASGDLLVTGPTGTNVNDLVVVLVE
jgi:glycerate 2-kinase